jgi:hypothetical protein
VCGGVSEIVEVCGARERAEVYTIAVPWRTGVSTCCCLMSFSLLSCSLSVVLRDAEKVLRACKRVSGKRGKLLTSRLACVWSELVTLQKVQ